MQGRKQKILVISTDFDGCWFHGHGRLSQSSKNPLIDHNPLIIDKIKNTIVRGKFDRVIFMVGSNRQSQPVDSRNAQHNRTTSCFYALQKICAHICAEINNDDISFSVDSYLLSDTYGNKADGENFNNALIHKQNYKFSDWFFDESKLTILYAQMHKIATQYPETDITYCFYDDRYYERQGELLDPDDILLALHDFFKSNPDLIPENVKLSLNHYDGDVFANIAKISGQGIIDAHYPHSIRMLIECAELDYVKDFNEYNRILHKLDENGGLSRFKDMRLKSALQQGLFKNRTNSDSTTCADDKTESHNKYSK